MTMKKLVVLGGGESGVGTALLARQKGWLVFLSDKGMLKEAYRQELLEAGISFEEGGHSIEKIMDADEVVKSPGIPDKVELVVALRQKGIPVISEIEFAARYTSARKICITGSNGKTTTTLLIHHILKQAGINAELAGNVGTSMARRIASGSHPDWYVIELSSFQLDGMFDFKADIAVLTNITPDHLDRYDYQFENYIRSKFRILQNQTAADYFIYCGDDAVTVKALGETTCQARQLPFSLNHIEVQGACLKDGALNIRVDDQLLVVDVERLPIKGRHNQYNAMAASLVASILKLDPDSVLSGLYSFKGVEHRLEPVATVRGVSYVNDSKATNVDSAWYALECMTQPVVWIAGGTDKGNDYSTLFELVRHKVKALVCLGKDNSKLVASFGGVAPTIVETASMADAVQAASELASAGDVVLLSPCCASFDLFNNYEHRGDLFKACVHNL